MKRLLVSPWTRVAVLIGVTVAGYRLAGGAVTRVEATLAAALARFVGIDGVYPVQGTSLVRGSHHGQLYLISVTDTCSALSPGLAIAGLSILVLGGSMRAKIIGLVVGIMPLVLGNSIRIAAILWVGNRSGTSDLVTFHDQWGTLFSLLYLLVAFALVVGSRLPSGRAWRRDEPRTYGL